ncbi:MAG: D-alanyl-D-alanine carboxypeptidase, partial [Bacteroidaceae bacterium]|nr:D-alanyl-D-alanine carboxypeptidase [Bacteroidaceae bacterium]
MKYKSLLSVFLLASHACAVLAQDVIPQRYPVEKQSQGVEEIRVRTEYALMYDSVPESDDSLILPPADSIPEAHALSWSGIVKERLAAMAREADQANFNTGLCVYDLTGDSLLFTYNHNKVMRPASTQKILTAVSALDLLGKNYFLKTRTYYDGTIQQVQHKIPNPSKEIDSLAVDS